MDPKKKAAIWKVYFIELLNADILDNTTRREKQYGPEPKAFSKYFNRGG